jgi:hypothetical protein
MHKYRRMICDMLLSETVQIDGNVVDIPRSLNLQRVYETIELSVLECIPKTQNGADVADCFRQSVSDTTRIPRLASIGKCTISMQASISGRNDFLRVVQPCVC